MKKLVLFALFAVMLSACQPKVVLVEKVVKETISLQEAGRMVAQATADASRPQRAQAQLPVQMISPNNGHQFGENAINLSWSSTELPEGMVYRLQVRAAPPAKVSSQDNLDVLTAGTEWNGWWPVTSGYYVWAVTVVDPNVNRFETVDMPTNQRFFSYRAPRSLAPGTNREPTPVPFPSLVP